MASPENKKFLCPDHPTKQLIFACELCSRLICNRCKKTDHEGHRTRDVGKSAADARKQLQARRRQAEARITTVSTEIGVKQKDLEDLEVSIEHAKDTLKERGELIKRWVDNHVQKKQNLVDRFAAKIGHAALAEDVKRAEERLEQLRDEARAIAEMLQDDVPDHQVYKYAVASRDTSNTSLQEKDVSSDSSRHESHVFLPDTDFVQWRSVLRDFLACPGHAQLSPTTRDQGVAVTHTLTASTDREARVLGVHVTDSGHLCVALLCCEGGPGKGAAVLRVYDRVGKLVTEQDLPKMVRVVMTSSPGGKLLVVCTYSGAKVTADLNLGVNPSDPATDELNSKVYAFNRDPSSENKISLGRKFLPGARKEQHKLYEVSADSSRAVNTVQVDDPQHVVADASGEYFAVIHQGKVAVAPTAQAAQPSSITVFRKPTLSPSRKAVELEKRVEWRPDAAPSTPSTPLALCFTGRQRQWLAVLDAASDAVYMLDYEDGRGVLTTYVSGCPLVHRPSAVTSDPKGRLVLGCRGGVVVTVVPREEVAEGDYFIPRVKPKDDLSEYDSNDDLDADDNSDRGDNVDDKLDDKLKTRSNHDDDGAGDRADDQRKTSVSSHRNDFDDVKVSDKQKTGHKDDKEDDTADDKQETGSRRRHKDWRVNDTADDKVKTGSISGYKDDKVDDIADDKRKRAGSSLHSGPTPAPDCGQPDSDHTGPVEMRDRSSHHSGPGSTSDCGQPGSGHTGPVEMRDRGAAQAANRNRLYYLPADASSYKVLQGRFFSQTHAGPDSDQSK